MAQVFQVSYIVNAKMPTRAITHELDLLLSTISRLLRCFRELVVELQTTVATLSQG